jgi:acyl carrier protein phosphodiesterase
MNHLAHLYLAGHSHGLIVGGFIADQVKGLIPGTYSEEVRKGIQLHRMIDAFTDSHNLVRQAQRLLPKSFGRSRGIIIDVFFDHLLAEDFQIISGQQLATFSMEMQTILKKHNELLPANWAEFFRKATAPTGSTITRTFPIANSFSKRLRPASVFTRFHRC